jgi:predicted NBD/HSP70 family sugar kinase
VVVDGELVRGAHGVAGELGHVMVDPRGPVCACGARGCLEVYVGTGHTVKPKRAIEALATALRPVVHLVDPQAVILGGALADSSEIADGLALALNTRTLAGARRPVEIRRSALGAGAAAVGGASRALDRVLADPTLVPELAASQSA